MKVAIVGAEGSRWKDDYLPKNEIRMIMDRYTSVARPTGAMPTLVSGRCPKGGVDVWAEEINKESYNWPTEIYPPKFNTWPGYRERNLKIARACDILVCISVKGRWDGGRWTAVQAKALKKDVVVIEL